MSTEQRETPLARKLKERIISEGPVSVAEYMRACLHDPQYGYYRQRSAIGAEADFITGPEISQVFGELIGLWCAVVWQQMGAPGTVHLIELGPGRGTMMSDMLRAARLWPAFIAAIRVHLIESNSTLREVQRNALASAQVKCTWHSELSSITAPTAIAAGPTILVANEFLDALPVEQFVCHEGRWHLRTVGLDSVGNFAFGLGGRYENFEPLPALAGKGVEGDIAERCGLYADVASALLRRAAGASAAALFIDYGHYGMAFGDTLQAVTRQQHISIFAAPGESDLTSAVDFGDFAGQFSGMAESVAVDGPASQAGFLGSLGISERASRLMAANPEQASEIEAGFSRLMAPFGMGTRFKALGVRSAPLPPLPGFNGQGR
jgi:SAM-dependent MidA family methyltransferase